MSNDMSDNKLPPYVKGSDTSREAAEAFRDISGKVARTVYSVVVLAGTRGATCDEIEVALRMRHQTVSARLRELRDAGRIRDSGARRLTRSQRNAAVYVTNDKVPRAAQVQMLRDIEFGA